MGKTICIELPKSITQLWKSEKELTREMKESFVLDLIRKHKISFRQGAKLLRMEYWDFLEFMSERGVPVIDYPPEDLDRELEALRNLERAK